MTSPSVASRLLQSVALRFGLVHAHVETVISAIREHATADQDRNLPVWLTTLPDD